MSSEDLKMLDLLYEGRTCADCEQELVCENNKLCNKWSEETIIKKEAVRWNIAYPYVAYCYDKYGVLRAQDIAFALQNQEILQYAYGKKERHI